LTMLRLRPEGQSIVSYANDLQPNEKEKQRQLQIIVWLCLRRA